MSLPPSKYTGIPTAEEVRELFVYEPDTGIFRFRRGGHRWKARETAGTQRKDGYWFVSIRHKKYRANRVAWIYMTGQWPQFLVDHKDVDPSNNRWLNLREATKTQNAGNTLVKAKCAAGLKGVRRDKKKWSARIGGRHLGMFDSPELAHAAYCAAAIKYFGEFARAA